MADMRPTKVTFLRAAHLCVLLLLSPSRFIEAEQQDNATRNNYVDAHERPHGAHVVRHAFGVSLVLVVASALLGAGVAKLTAALGRCSTDETVMWLQIAGASLLLWGTLFIRGWEIQTYSGVGLTERVNQWLYRTLYCVGTSVVVYSLVFASCKV